MAFYVKKTFSHIDKDCILYYYCIQSADKKHFDGFQPASGTSRFHIPKELFR